MFWSFASEEEEEEEEEEDKEKKEERVAGSWRPLITERTTRPDESSTCKYPPANGRSSCKVSRVGYLALSPRV